MSEERDEENEQTRLFSRSLALDREYQNFLRQIHNDIEQAFCNEYEQTPFIQHAIQENIQIQKNKEKQSSVIHTCYVCDSNILKYHALGMYYYKKRKIISPYILHEDCIDHQTKNEFNKIWNSKHVKFLCCKCVEEMHKVDKNRKDNIELLQKVSKSMFLLGFNTLDLNVIIDDLKNKLENNELPHFIELKELHEQLKKKNSNFVPWYIEAQTDPIHIYDFEQSHENEHYIE